MTPTRLVLWDVDRTLLVGGGVALEAYRAAFTAVTGVPWRGALVAAGRTDATITPELFAQHGLDATGVVVEEFFARYAAEFAGRAHELPVRGHLLPGSRPCSRRWTHGPRCCRRW